VGLKYATNIDPVARGAQVLRSTTKKRSSTFFRKKVHPRSFCGPNRKILAMHLFSTWVC